MSTESVTESGPLRGEVAVFADKSIAHRAAILAAWARGESRIANYPPGKDNARTLAALQRLGVVISLPEGDGAAGGGEVTIRGAGLDALQEPETVVDCGNSGTTLRLLTGVVAGRPFLTVLSGDASLRSRPMRRVAEPLRKMGARVLGRENGSYPPLVIEGQALRGMQHRLPVASAQVKSALLLAGLQASAETEVEEPAPSRDHTERMLRHLGVEVEKREKRIRIRGGGVPRPSDFRLPGDFSSAAFFLVAASVVRQSEVTLRDVGVNPTRTGALEVLRRMGAAIDVHHPRESGGEPIADVTGRSARLHGAEIGGDLIPRCLDEIPVLAVAALAAEGTTRIRDAGELRVKESDRLAAIRGELVKLGAKIQEKEDGLVIEGGHKLRGARVSSRGDHRMAMALAVAALAAEGETVIEDAGCVSVSYPGFFETLAVLAS